MWWINSIHNMPHFRSDWWLSHLRLWRHCSSLPSELYEELTQLELMVNDRCWLPPGTHLSCIKVCVLAVFSAHVIHCNELCPTAQVLREREKSPIDSQWCTSRWHNIIALSNIMTGAHWRHLYKGIMAATTVASSKYFCCWLLFTWCTKQVCVKKYCIHPTSWHSLYRGQRITVLNSF